MQDFIFQNKTKIYFGKDQLGHLGEEISRFGKKVLLVYGGGSIKKIGLYDKVMKELEKAGMTQSMSRVAKCIDNGPMEGFWGILKRERYYGNRFSSREELVSMIENYIYYYNNERYQRRFGVLTPIEKHNSYLLAA